MIVPKLLFSGFLFVQAPVNGNSLVERDAYGLIETGDFEIINYFNQVLFLLQSVLNVTM